MRIFSTFSGIGGFEVGIHNAYGSTLARVQRNTQKELAKRERLFAKTGKGPHPSYGWTSKRLTDLLDERPLCIGYSEIDKYAASVYEKHYPGVKNYGDITKINAEELPDFDCLVGGFPCQAFSIAGKRGGFEDTRGTLFFDLARILRAKRPRLFVFENVKGLLSHDNGNTFKIIVSTIDELGYDCQWQVLNSKDFGVPQNRERIIIVGHRRGTRRPEVFPITGTNGSATKESSTVIGSSQRHAKVSTDGIVPTLSSAMGMGGGQTPMIIPGTLRTFKDGEGFRELHSGLSPTIPARAREDGSGQPVIIAAQRGRYNKKAQIEQQLEPRYDGVSNTLTAVQKDNMLYKPMIRRLTPKECERLQAFPDDWTKLGTKQPHEQHTCFRCEDEELQYCPENIIEISDTQRYKMCGNAVTTNVIQAVFERIFNN